jgi:hypothetical protein
LFCRPYCHRQGLGDPYYREAGPGMALADTDLHNAGQQQILASNPANLNASLNAFCNDTMVTPIQAYGAHVSSLGLKFYNGEPCQLVVGSTTECSFAFWWSSKWWGCVVGSIRGAGI